MKVESREDGVWGLPSVESDELRITLENGSKIQIRPVLVLPEPGIEWGVEVQVSGVVVVAPRANDTIRLLDVRKGE